MARFDVPTVDPVIAGDYERIKFELMQAKENETDPDVPQDISGWTLRFGAKIDVSDTEYIAQKSSAVPGEFEITDAANGTGYIILDGTDLASITYETVLICDLVGTDASGRDYTTKFYLPVEMGVSS